MKINFIAVTNEHLPLWEKWIQKKHVKDAWFIEGYETIDYIHQKIAGNGYDHSYIIYGDNYPIGYIQCCDLYAYKTICPNPKGLFTNENSGTFCMDLFIGEEDYLHKGYGTQIVKSFTTYIFEHFNADIILIDPAASNKAAIRCYEKAGFSFLKEANDGITDCYVMKITKDL